MNENNQTPNQFPPMIPAASRIPDPQYLPLGEHPDDRSELGGLLGLLAGLLALATLLLIGFAPVAWIFSQSTESVAGMGMLHVAFWIVSVGFGARFLQSGFRHLAIRSPAGINVWILIFLLVVMQMTTALRPLVGKADTLLPKEKKFFLVHWVDCMDGAKETRGAAKPE